jgi:hypothetical protein
MKIECSKCEDIVDVEARTVVSPFVCKWCEEGFTPTDHVYAAVPDATDTQFDFDTEIIEDLETRLSDANAVIERLETQVDYWREAYRDLAIVRNGLEANLRVEQRKTWWERLWE